MDINKLTTKYGIVIIILCFFACDPCKLPPDNLYSKIPNLISINPLKSIYNKGDEIIISMILPSEVMLIDSTIIDIYKETGIENKESHASDIYDITRYNENKYTIVEGGHNAYQPILKYYPLENEYRFKIKVILNKLGDYSLNNEVRFAFRSLEDCQLEYSIQTNIEGMSENGTIEFTVE